MIAEEEAKRLVLIAGLPAGGNEIRTAGPALANGLPDIVERRSLCAAIFGEKRLMRRRAPLRWSISSKSSRHGWPHVGVYRILSDVLAGLTWSRLALPNRLLVVRMKLITGANGVRPSIKPGLFRQQ
jgi:hypothetical protein